MFINVYSSLKKPVRRGALLGSALALFWVAVSLAAPTLPSGSDSPKNRKVQADWGRLPLAFMENRGQTAPEVKFYHQGRGLGAFFAREGIFLKLDGARPARWIPERALNFPARSRQRPPTGRRGANPPGSG